MLVRLMFVGRRRHGAPAVLIGSLLLFSGFSCNAALGQAPGVPITAVSVNKQDVPIWLRGLGTVQANLVVQIRSRVDGVLTEVPVKEGQDVKQGDLLTVIDPRPYQAALDGATAKRNQDLAQLANAQADLARYSSLVAGNFASRQQLETQQ